MTPRTKAAGALHLALPRKLKFCQSLKATQLLWTCHSCGTVAGSEAAQ